MNDDEHRAEKARLKALVRSFVKEAKSGLNCDFGYPIVPARLFLDATLTLTLVHSGDKTTRIPLIHVVGACSSEVLMENFPDSQLMHNSEGEEDCSKAVFIQHQTPGFPKSWVRLSLIDEEAKERCVDSINILRMFAEIEQQRHLERQRTSA